MWRGWWGQFKFNGIDHELKEEENGFVRRAEQCERRLKGM